MTVCSLMWMLTSKAKLSTAAATDPGMNPETKQKAVKSSHNWKLNEQSTHNNQWLPEEMAEELRKYLGMSKIPQSQMRVTLRGSPAVELTGNSGTPQKTGNRVHLKALLHEDQANPETSNNNQSQNQGEKTVGKAEIHAL